jgi:hypothetical protein
MLIRTLGTVPYLPTYADMQDFTAQRSEDTPDELWLCEHPPDLHARHGRRTAPCGGRRQHPCGRHQPGRAGHLPRSGAGRRLPAHRSAARALLRQGIRVPPGRGRDSHAGALWRDRTPGGLGPRHLCAAGRPTEPCPTASAPTKGRGRRPTGTRFHRPGKNRRAGHQGESPPHLPRRGAQCRHGPGTLPAHQPLWLRRLAKHGRPFYNRGSHHLGRGWLASWANSSRCGWPPEHQP